MNLKDKVAVVTGGAKGNGLGIVEVFVKYGAKVVILDKDEKIAEVVKKFREDSADVKGCLVDIRNQQEVNEAIKKVNDYFGKIDILVNNAGVCKLTPFEQMDNEIRDFHFDVNIKGSFNVTQACLPYMNQNSSIINLSSVTGCMVADPGEVAYATTKAALIGFTKSLAVELAPKNIRVNAISPGYIRTPMVEDMARISNPEDPESVIKGIGDAIPMKRLGYIQEIGELAAFLASDASSYITGENIVISGGSTLPETLTMGV